MAIRGVACIALMFLAACDGAQGVGVSPYDPRCMLAQGIKTAYSPALKTTTTDVLVSVPAYLMGAGYTLTVCLAAPGVATPTAKGA